MAASREEVFERVKEVLTEQLGIEEGDITEEASFQEDLDADSLDLGRRLAAFNEGEDVARLAKNRNILAALLEAVLGALFLEHGFAAIEEAIVDAFSERIEYGLTTHVDHKTELQEALARAGKQVSYMVVDSSGPPHDRHFTSAAVVDGEQFGLGEGKSKKAAEQEAAKQALAALEPTTST